MLYASASCGVAPDRPAGTGSGTDSEAAPVDRSAENFSPRSLTAPPPCGSEITDPDAPADVVDTGIPFTRARPGPDRSS
ncbi:hypothetical protein [Kutzneria chonburiensis]|uniref:hypothetical protein n=1 Tax=Kutzneria chonburiensis TaxID=1483604 RepID=UPI00236094B1|nr:hypothetical protein [Kutzneria chonburiensis]